MAANYSLLSMLPSEQLSFKRRFPLDIERMIMEIAAQAQSRGEAMHLLRVAKHVKTW